MEGKKGNKGVTRDRAKHRCKPELKRLIDLVNSIPPDRKLPHLFEIFPENPNHRGFLSPTRDGFDRLKELLDGVPLDFFGNMNISDKYETFRHICKTLHELAQLATMSPREREAFNNPDFVFVDPNRLPDAWQATSRYDEMDGRSRWRWPRADIGIDPDTGLIGVMKNEWLLDLVGIEATRLRECEMCQRIFWARQDNMVACSSSCSNANRQRTFREKRTQYQQARQKKERSVKTRARQK
jgi:hypothetical protein